MGAEDMLAADRYRGTMAEGLDFEIARRNGRPGEPSIVEYARLAADPNPFPTICLFRWPWRRR